MTTPSRADRPGESQALPTEGVSDVSIHVQAYVLRIGQLNGDSLVAEQIGRDLEARIALGVERYGKRLQTLNGRNMLLDAYEEALDLLHYAEGDHLEHPDDSRSMQVLECAAVIVFHIRALLDRRERQKAAWSEPMKDTVTKDGLSVTYSKSSQTDLIVDEPIT